MKKKPVLPKIYSDIRTMLEYAKAKKIDPRAIYNVEKVAKMMDISEKSAYRYIQDGELRAVKPTRGKKLEILGQWILDYIADQTKTIKFSGGVKKS